MQNEFLVPELAANNNGTQADHHQIDLLTYVLTCVFNITTFCIKY